MSFFFIIVIFIGMLHYIILSNTTCYLHWIYSGYFYIEFTVVILSSWIVTSIYNANCCVCMLVLSLIVLSLQCVMFLYFVLRFREFFECFVVFFLISISFFMGQFVCLRYCCYWAFSFVMSVSVNVKVLSTMMFS
jgi:hypothetical protein